MSAILLPAPEVPFFPPLPLRIADFDGEYFAEENGAVLMPGQTTKMTTLGHALHNPSVPVLAFTAALYQELRYLAVSIPTEWAVFLLLKRLSTAKPHFLAFDWFMTDQRASAGEVCMDADDARRYYRVLEETPYYKEHGLHRHLCHLHSHAKMNVFFSSIDHNQQMNRDELGFYDDFRFYAVVNAQGEIKVSFVTYVPVLGQFEAVPALLFSKPEYVGELTAERKRDIDARVAALVHTNTPVLCLKNNVKNNKKQPARTEKKDKNVGRNANNASVENKDFRELFGNPVLENPHLLSTAEEREKMLRYMCRYAEKSDLFPWDGELPGPAFVTAFDEAEEYSTSLSNGVVVMAEYLDMQDETDTLFAFMRAVNAPCTWDMLNGDHWEELAAFLDLVAALSQKGEGPLPKRLENALLRFAEYEPFLTMTVKGVKNDDDLLTLLISAATAEKAYDTPLLYGVVLTCFRLICRHALPATDAQAEALC